jgi:TolA-binding protein
MEYAKRAFEHIVIQIGDSPLAISARLGLAGVLEQKGLYLEAIDSYEEVASKHAKSVQALQAIMRIGDLWFDKLSRIDNAEKAYARILKDYPGNKLSIQAHFKLGECALKRGDYHSALKAYQDVLLKSKTDQKKAQLAMAQLEFYYARPSKALRYLQAFSQPDNTPDDVENDALELLFLIQQNQHDSLGLATLGTARLFEFQNKYSEAIQMLETFIADFPLSTLNEEMVLLLANLYRKQKRFDIAIRKLEMLYNRENSLYGDFALHQMALICERDLMDVDKAQMHYETLLTQYPQSIFVEEARQRLRELEGNR